MYSIVLKSDVSRIFTINISNGKENVPTSLIPVFRSKSIAQKFSQEVLRNRNLYSTTWKISTCNFDNNITLSTDMDREEKIRVSCEYEEIDVSNISVQQQIGIFVIHLYYTNELKCYLDGNIKSERF